MRGWILLLLLLAPAAAGAAPDVVLITLDTTRADAIGKGTPHLEALAKEGLRYARALTPAPLTLPAHASMLTGLEPPQHGVHDNGTAALPNDVPTLASMLRRRGYATGAFVASRVLDRRFGLHRGFSHYDDTMAAEQIGEYGYPERDAKQVTDAALEWASKQSADKPLFLWVHYYDPHAPYEHGGYTGEVAYVDGEVGRLLGKLRGAKRIVVVAGDHGESLGEHGERTHGVFLYRAVLEVPLIIAGAGRKGTIPHVVSTKRIAATIAHLVEGEKEFGDPLPPFSDAVPPVYSETYLPATAYGWAPLRAYTEGPLRVIDAPRVELYDYVADPKESRNLAADRRRDLFRLKNALDERVKAMGSREASVAVDPGIAQSLRSLGYLSGVGGGARGSNLDPKDGIVLLAAMEAIRGRLGDAKAAARAEELVKQSPGNVPFLTLAGEAWLAAGDTAKAIDAHRRAAALNPSLDFLHLNLGDAYHAAGDMENAEKEYRLALRLNPRMAAAALKLAALKPKEARAILRASVEAKTTSASVLTRLAELEIEAGRGEAADRALQEAVRIAPRWAPAWMLIGDRASDVQTARNAWRSAAAYAPRDPRPLLALAKSFLTAGDRVQARTYLDRVIALAPKSKEAAEARKLLR